MIPSIDYLTCVLAGACLFYVGVDSLVDRREDAPVIFWISLLTMIAGTILFVTGATAAFIGALGFGGQAA